MWIGVLWAGLRVAMWIAHVGGKFRHGLLEKSLTNPGFRNLRFLGEGRFQGPKHGCDFFACVRNQRAANGGSDPSW